MFLVIEIALLESCSKIGRLWSLWVTIASRSCSYPFVQKNRWLLPTHLMDVRCLPKTKNLRLFEQWKRPLSREGSEAVPSGSVFIKGQTNDPVRNAARETLVGGR